jgi:hypothetical protein
MDKKQYMEKWRKENHDKILKSQREYRKAHAEQHVINNLRSRKKRYSECPWMKHHDSMKKNKRKLKCEVTLDFVKIVWFRDRAFNMKRPSVDRIDQLGHYTPKNIRFIELSENVSRGNKSREREKNGRLLAGRNYHKGSLRRVAI